ncbi:MAG: outer rane lipoprotein carrier protein LolA [Fibrobacteres bacterium]|nr:outer rane lipoprotein carrier protein LolA [Fibrobacterota bacterium]
MPDSAIYLLRKRPYRGLLLATAFLAITASGPLAADTPPPAPTAASGAAPAESAMRTEARNALRKAVTFHREAKDLTLKFKASVYNAALDKQDEYQGKLLLKGANKFRLEIPGGTYVSNGATFWEYHAQNHQVVLKGAKDLEDQPLPGDVLLRFLDSDPLSLAKAKDGSKEFLELRLDPSRAMKNLDSLAVLLNKKDFSVHRISSRDVSGNEARYTVTAVKRNGGIKDKEFTFAVPKDAEVVDMREQ